MQYKKINDIYVLRLDLNENIIESIKVLCEENNIKAAMISGLGVARDVELICYNRLTKSSKKEKFIGDYEISSLIGNISILDNEILVHLHINLTDENFKVFGGHLVTGKIGMTGEIFIQVLEGKIKRVKDKNFDIQILSLD